MARESARILLIDDGELEAVAGLLERQGLTFERLRGSLVEEPVGPPRELLVVTPTSMDRVRRGSPPEAAPGRPLRVIAASEDSPALRRRLRRSGFQLLVRQPADAEIWRLLVARACYHGSERREAPRVAVGAPVEVADAGSLERPVGQPSGAATILLDLSNRGCRLRTTRPVAIGDVLCFSLPDEATDEYADSEPLALRGRVRRLSHDPGCAERTLALVFDPDLEDSARTRLAAVINRWASGPSSMGGSPPRIQAPPLPPCRLPSLPDLMLDDETDPPVSASSELRVELSEPDPLSSATPPTAPAAAAEQDRRRRPRGRFESSFLAEAPSGPIVLIGRDLSAAGMRIERIDEFRLGNRFRLALHGPTLGEPLIVAAEVARDDGPDGFSLVFRDLDRESATAIEKLAACLPHVESLEESEPGGLVGAILSELVSG